MYPIKFNNLYYNKIWGGRDLEKFRYNLPEGTIGESWDIACHENGMGIVSNGYLKGESFEDLIKKYNYKLLGYKFKDKGFPLLIKLINSKEKLSVQVHPNDEYANKYEHESGKTEAWYVVDAKPGASLIIGTKDCNKETFRKAVEQGNTEKFLNKIEVKKGDCFLINSGLVHAICEGVTIAEIQQNSDVTYRIYDYGRDRELHLDKALDVIDFNLKAINAIGELESYAGYSKGLLCKNKYFTIEKYVVRDLFKENSDKDRFFVFTCVEGKGIIYSREINEEIAKGDSILIPASLGEYVISGDLTLLKSCI